MAKDGGKSQGGTLHEGGVTDIVDLTAIRTCNEANSSFGDLVCSAAIETCNDRQITPYVATGYSLYDMRITCDNPPLCLDWSHVENFLNQREVQEAIDASKKWEIINPLVNQAFQTDYM